MVVVSPRRCSNLRFFPILAAVCCTAVPALADPVTWISPSSDLWTNPANWSSDPFLPDPSSDVIINQPGPLTVTLSSGNQSINSLLLNNTLLLTGGSLSVATTAQVAGQLTLAGGALQNATLSTTSPGTITLTSGTLNNITLASNIALTNPALSINNNLTLAHSTLTLSATTAASLSFSGNESLAGTGTIIFNGTRSNALLGTTANLTIAPGITLATGSASASIQLGALINQGTLAAQISGKSIAINGPSFTNAGTLQALNGGTLTINSAAWTSPGSITLDNASTLNLGGTFLPPALTAISRTGGTVNITGVLDNANNTLALNTPSAAYVLLGGTLSNGFVSLAAGGSLTLASSANLSITALSIASGGQLLQTAGALAVPSITQSGGTISLGGTQPHYTLTSLTITGGTTTLTNDAPKTLITPALTFGGSSGNWTGKLDLGANKLIVQPVAAAKANTFAALQDQVLYGITHPAGITSTKLPANMAIAVVDNASLPTPFTTFGGQSVSTNSLLVSAQLLGDADLSGTVDLNDLNTVLNHLGTTTPNWTAGNFDGAPAIDLTDLADVLGNLGASYPSTPATGASETFLPISSVPEPITSLLPALPILLQTRRPRRNHRISDS